MSTINKEPFIKKLLASCSDEELATLSTLVDGGGDQTPLRRTANPIATEAIPHITSDDMGIHLCNLTINYTNFFGYLVYTDDYCALISFTDAQVLKVFDLTESKVQPDTVDEAINILELRSALYEAKGGEGGGGGSSEDTPKKYEVEDIENIPAEILNELKVGDVVSHPNGFEIDLYTVVQVSNSEFRIGVGLMFFNGLSSTYVSYALNGNEWECDYREDNGYSPVYMVEDISDLSPDFFELIGPEAILLTYTDEKWTPIYTGGEDGVYFQKIGADAITMVHYGEDDDTGDFVFDDSYGTDGFLTIPLGGGSGGNVNPYLTYAIVRNSIRLTRGGDTDASVIISDTPEDNSFSFDNITLVASIISRADSTTSADQAVIPFKMKFGGDVCVCFSEATAENSWDITGASVNGLYIIQASCSIETDFNNNNQDVLVFSYASRYSVNDPDAPEYLPWYY